MLDHNTREQVLELLRDKGFAAQEINSCQMLGGGSINDVYQLNIAGELFVLKANTPGVYPQMFEKEAKGLALLKSESGFKIPEVIGFVENESTCFLLLEYIPTGNPSNDFWESFAEKLAQLHQVKSRNDKFGLGYDNYIGSLHQANDWENDWPKFYVEHRLVPLFEKAVNLFDKNERKHLENLINRLEDLIPKESSVLVHGDLWSGNYLVSDQNEPTLIDPAVYYGHREMELAFMQMFGGYDSSLFETYDEILPLEKGFESRKEIHQLYPLLVHSVLFGGLYVQQVKGILRKFS